MSDNTVQNCSMSVSMDNVVDIEALQVLQETIESQNKLVAKFLEKSQPQNAYGV